MRVCVWERGTEREKGTEKGTERGTERETEKVRQPESERVGRHNTIMHLCNMQHNIKIKKMKSKISVS